MSIDINGLPPSGVKRAEGEAVAKAQREQPTAADAEKNRPSFSDAASFTDVSSRLQELEKKLAALPVVDSQRVEGIKKALADGSYKIDPETIADKLTNVERLLDQK